MLVSSAGVKLESKIKVIKFQIWYRGKQKILPIGLARVSRRQCNLDIERSEIKVAIGLPHELEVKYLIEMKNGWSYDL